MEVTFPFYKRSGFWRGFVFWALFLSFLFLFWKELLDIYAIVRALAIIFATEPFSLLNDLRRAELFQIYELDAAKWMSLRDMLVSAVYYYLLYFLSVFIAAQFTLPVTRWGDRKKAFLRLLLSRFKWKGPAVFVKEGRLVAQVGEKDNIGPGVALVDLSSAIVLEQQYWYGDTPHEDELPGDPYLDFQGSRNPLLYRRVLRERAGTPGEDLVRVHGPGVVFTDWGERLRSVIDLRRQVRMERGVKVLTRDGIEIQTNVYVVFGLSDTPDVIPVAYVGGSTEENLCGLDLEYKDGGIVRFKRTIELDHDDRAEIHNAVIAGKIRPAGPPQPSRGRDRGGIPYPFHAQRVFDAAYAEARYLPENEKTILWHELPLMITKDIFQTALSRYTFDHMFVPVSVSEEGAEARNQDTGREDEPFLKIFKRELSWKVKLKGLISYSLVRPVPSASNGGSRLRWNESFFPAYQFPCEYEAAQLTSSDSHPLTSPKVLRDRGIAVVVAGFPEFIAPEAIRGQLVESWKARIDREIKIIMAKHERQANQVINNARTQSQRENTFFLSNIFDSVDYSKEALALLIFQALENLATDPRSQKDVPPKEVLAMLQNLHRWLLIEWKDVDRQKKREEGHTDSQGDGRPPMPEGGR